MASRASINPSAWTDGSAGSGEAGGRGFSSQGADDVRGRRTLGGKVSPQERPSALRHVPETRCSATNQGPRNSSAGTQNPRKNRNRPAPQEGGTGASPRPPQSHLNPSPYTLKNIYTNRDRIVHISWVILGSGFPRFAGASAPTPVSGPLRPPAGLPWTPFLGPLDGLRALGSSPRVS